jgi:phage shock protein PspC (stress-responsive transcriptional regulator)
MERNRSNWLSILGVALVVLGVWLIFERTLVPLVRPLAAVMHTLGHVAWPVALIALGALILSRPRGAGAKTAWIVRSRSNRVIGGVLGGVGARLGIEPNIVRVIYTVFTLAGSLWVGVVLYVLALAFLPEESVFASDVPTSPPAPAAPAPPAPAIPSTPSAPARAEG